MKKYGAHHLSSSAEGHKPSIRFPKQSVRVGGNSQEIRISFWEKR